LPEGKYVKIDIKDTGNGIPHDQINRIFEPFYTTKKDGSGMGLSICYSIMKKHGGHITVESQPGVGTVFTLYLPAEDNINSENVAPVIPKVIPKYSKILVLDDENYVLDMISMILNDLKLNHIVCQHSDIAITAFKKAKEHNEPFDLVLLDMTIKGGIGGDEVMKELLNIQPDLKGIAMSGYSNNQVLADPLNYGFNASIRKPFTVNDLSNILSSL